MKTYEELTEQERSQIVGFSIPDSTKLVEIHETPLDRNEAIAELIEEETYDRPLRDLLPETIEVIGLRRIVIYPSDLKSMDILDRLLERMDEEYKHEDDDWSQETTQGMVEAEDEFLEKVIAEYTVTNLEPVCSDEILIGEFVNKHCPDWLLGEDPV